MSLFPTDSEYKRPMSLFPTDSEYKRLEAAAALMTKWSKRGIRYEVGRTWLNSNYLWTTIIANRKNGDSWQALYPAEQKRILTAGSLEEAVKEYFAGALLDEMAPES